MMGVRRPAYIVPACGSHRPRIPRVNWLASKLWVQVRENSSKIPDVNCAPINKCTRDPEYTCTVCRQAKQYENEGVHLVSLLMCGTGQWSSMFPPLGCLSPGVGPLHPMPCEHKGYAQWRELSAQTTRKPNFSSCSAPHWQLGLVPAFLTRS